MKTLDEYSDLEKELEKYIRAKFVKRNDTLWEKLLKHNLWLKLGSVSFAAIIWFFTAYKAEIVEKTFMVPVTFERMPKEVVVESYSPKEIAVVASGRGNNTVNSLLPADFKIVIDATDLKDGLNKETISRKNIVVPAPLNLKNFEPTSVLLTAKKFYIVSVPVGAKIKGTVADNLDLKSVMVTPEKVDVWVPEGVAAPAEIPTETIDITNQSESVIIPTKLVLPENIRLVNGDSTANVALTIEEKSKQ